MPPNPPGKPPLKTVHSHRFLKPELTVSELTCLIHKHDRAADVFLRSRAAAGSQRWAFLGKSGEMQKAEFFCHLG